MAELIPMAKKDSPRKKNLEWKVFEAFLDSLERESDRGAVLISAALLDDLLARSIHALLLDHPLADRLLDGPLGSAYSRALTAFVLGILSESEYQDCERVRSVRNHFGHEVDCSFETPKVKEICSTFAVGDTPPRGKYFSATIKLLATLWRRPSDVSKRRLKYVKPQ